MAVITPDKAKKPDVKAVDIMDSSWAKNTAGYEKTPSQTPVAKAPQVTPQQVAPAPPAAAAPATPVQNPTAVAPAAPLSPAAQTQQETVTPPSSDSPAIAAPEQNTAPSLALPAGALPTLASAFVSASNVPFWRQAHSLPKEDFFDADARRLHENALTAGLIDNGFEAQRTSATRALPGESSNANRESERSREEKEEKEKNRRLMDLLDLPTMQRDIRDIILNLDHTILEAEGIKAQLQNNLVEIRSEITALKAEIKTTEQNIDHLQAEKRNGQNYTKNLVDNYHDLHAEYNRKQEEDRIKFGTNDDGAVLSDPQDEILHQQAWDKNRDTVAKLYTDKGLAEEFKILERIKKGEPVDQKALEQATAKIKSQNLPQTLDQAMLKVDRQNEYFKTTSGLRVRIQENVGLIDHGNRYLEKNEEKLDKQIERLGRFKTRLSSVGGEEKATLDKMAKVDGFIEAKLEQRERAEALEKKINDPAFREAYAAGKISKEEMKAITNEFSQLKKDIEKTNTEFKQFKEENRGDFKRPGSSTAHETPAAAPLASAETVVAEVSRTTTDSVAGLTDSLKKIDKKAVSAFEKAASSAPAPAAAAPSTEADQTLTAAVTEQQRRPAATGMTV